MSEASGPSAAPQLPLQQWPAAGRWAALVAASLVLGGLLQWARLPGALLLGPLAAGILVQTAGGAVKISRWPMAAAQAVLGCLIAQSITPSIAGGFAHHWPVFLGVVTLVVAASAAIGWAMSRSGVIQGSTAVWGVLPGAATVMMVMAKEYGADFRLVAFMQYLRVVLVAAAASVVALMFAHGGGSRFDAGLFPPVALPHLAATAAIAFAGGGLGLAARIPAGVLLGPLALGAALNVLGWVTIELPAAVLIASFAVIGWNVGLRFTRDVLAAAARALPQTIGATVLLMAFCGVVAWLLVVLLHVDPLTAYLATTPGGMDAAAIIAASTKVDMAFVMALQAFRLVVLLVAGPPVARWVAGMLDRAPRHPEPVRPPDPGRSQ